MTELKLRQLATVAPAAVALVWYDTATSREKPDVYATSTPAASVRLEVKYPPPFGGATAQSCRRRHAAVVDGLQAHATTAAVSATENGATGGTSTAVTAAAASTAASTAAAAAAATRPSQREAKDRKDDGSQINSSVRDAGSSGGAGGSVAVAAAAAAAAAMCSGGGGGGGGCGGATAAAATPYHGDCRGSTIGAASLPPMPVGQAPPGSMTGAVAQTPPRIRVRGASSSSGGGAGATTERARFNPKKTLADLKKLPFYRRQVVHTKIIPARPCEYSSLTMEPALPSAVVSTFAALGLDRYFTHQAAGIDAARRGEHVMLSTATASGKSLVYNTAVFEVLVESPYEATAIYIFPTKALVRRVSCIIHGGGGGGYIILLESRQMLTERFFFFHFGFHIFLLMNACSVLNIDITCFLFYFMICALLV